jgi:hypothetical protein
MMRPGQTPSNKTPNIKGKEWTNIKDPSLSQKNKNPKWIIKGQRNKSCSKPPLVAISTLEKKTRWET